MRKNRILWLFAVVLVLTLVSTSLVAGTFAKYTKEVTASDEVRVAKFAFNLTDGGSGAADETTTLEQTFDIFSYTDAGVYADGVNTDKFIAPGTTGNIPISLTNSSEVDIEAAFDLTETNADSIPVYYTIGAETQRYSSVLEGDAYDTDKTYLGIEELSAALAIAKIEATNGTASAASTATLNWTWEFESAGASQTDTADTALGVDTTPPVVKLAIAVTVTQVD